MKSKKSENHINKYFSINEFLFRTLLNNELFFAKPSSFNDPFDCSFNIELVENSEVEEEFIRNILNTTNFTEESVPKIRDLYKEAIYKNNHLFYQITSDLGVTCFSKKNDNFLMWSHYANKHTGICLVFDTSFDEEYFMCQKVKYTKDLPIIDWSSNDKLHKQLLIPLTTKLIHWEYEAEVRSIVNIKDNKRTLGFNPKSLVGIVFGAKTSQNDIDILKRIISLHEGYSNVIYYNAILNRQNSKIEIS